MYTHVLDYFTGCYVTKHNIVYFPDFVSEGGEARFSKLKAQLIVSPLKLSKVLFVIYHYSYGVSLLRYRSSI